MRLSSVRPEFVEFIPSEREEGVPYPSTPDATGVHNCCCGCGLKVVTPLSPTDWSLIFDGETVSLTPSVGNWSFPCQSHYWIKGDKVVWAPAWSAEQIERGRLRDRAGKRRRYDLPE